jgi:hypothetical protein
MNMESHGGIILVGENRRIWRETYPSATSSTTNPTWNDPAANQGLRGERPATNLLSHGMTCFVRLSRYIVLTAGYVQFTFRLTFNYNIDSG